ncbi:uncharacterized protein [Linepithema humile]|uniref:uncharacterized protein n=1 Tax=Linepithema humile TaxID=83485 RepID=UPI00351DAF0D
MHVLKFTLLLCAIAGCWQPLSWTSLSKHVIYNVYRTLLICIASAFGISQFMNIIFNIDDFNEISESLYMTLAVLIAIYKIITMWIIDKSVIRIINALTEKSFKSRESCEVMLRQKYEKMIKKYAVWYYLLVQITVLCIIVNAVFMDLRKGNLTYRAWFPFDYTPPTIFYLVFTHQMVGMSITAVMNVACDSLIFGLLQQICYQIEILEYRLTKISLGQHIFRDCVRHHNHIYEYACTVNHRFAPLIALQFAVSMLVVCANLYKIAAMKINAGSVVLILYTACMLSQIFIYCWFGNELKLKSIDLANNIYNMDWYTLDTNSKKVAEIIIFGLQCVENSTVKTKKRKLMNKNCYCLHIDHEDMCHTRYVKTQSYKQLYMWIDRKHLMSLLNVFTEKPFAPYETQEVMIQEKFEKLVQRLTYKAWVPFNYSSTGSYYLVYTHQMIAMSTSGIVNVACESIIFGLLLHICCQFEILEYRLTKITHDEDILRDCINHHNRIFEYAYIVNNTFVKIIALQFAVSMLVVCSNLYRIAMATDYMSFIPLIMYTSAILVQIFIYCWFGNEVKLKSLHVMNSIYEMDWPALSNSNKKALLLIMKRTTTPIEFSSAYIITMNLDSFVALLKMSYSTFNLLHQSQ